MYLKDKPNPVVYLIIEIIMGMSIITIMVLSIVGFTSLQYSTRAMTDITKNWEKSPFTDMTVGTGGVCPSGYENFLDDEWGGTVNGCNCVGRYSYRIPYNKRDRLNRETCSWNMTLGGCSSVDSVSPMRYSFWRGNRICVKKTTVPFEIYLRNAVGKGGQCANGYKQCGLLDSVENILCVENDKECPINKILFQDTTTPDPTDYTYKKLTLNGRNLFFTNEAVNNKIYTDVKISEGDLCIDPEQKNTKFPSQYILERDDYVCEQKFEKYTFDNRFTALDSNLKKTLWLENGIMDVLPRLPFFPVYTLETDISIYTRPFIGWLTTCSAEDSFYTPKLVYDLNSQIDSFITNKLVIMIFSIILLVHFIVQMILKWAVCKESKAAFFILEWIHMGFCLIILIFAFIALARGGSYSGELDAFNCGDEITNALFRNVGEELSNNVAYDRAISALSVYCFSIYSLYILVEIFAKWWSNRESCSKSKPAVQLQPPKKSYREEFTPNTNINNIQGQTYPTPNVNNNFNNDNNKNPNVPYNSINVHVNTNNNPEQGPGPVVGLNNNNNNDLPYLNDVNKQ